MNLTSERQEEGKDEHDVGDRHAIPPLVALEGGFVGQRAEHVGTVSGAAGGHYEHDVEYLHREDEAEQEEDGYYICDQGHGYKNVLAHRPSTVECSRLVKFVGDAP